jgi:hypothetical protein
MQEILAVITANIQGVQGKAPILSFLILLGAYVLAEFIKKRRGHKRGGVLPALGKRAILTANELEFFGRLSRALPEYHVFPQVSLDALLCVSGGATYAEKTARRNMFSQKHPDFVICKRDTLEVIAIVELDDKTHNLERDQKRDSMLTGAGYRVERFSSKSKPSEAEIAKKFALLS